MAQGNAGIGGGLGKFTELRQRLLFVVGALIVYRIGCFIPVPGVNPDAMLAMMQAQGGGIVDMFNMFSGGALHRFSLFALNVMPYISASIVFQLAVHIFPSLKAMQKEGESGRRKITQYSRIGAVLLAVVQGGSIAFALQNQVAPGGMPVVYNPGMGFVLTAIVALTAGTIFLMWVGEQVTERGVGNGVSLIIFAGIVAGLPVGGDQHRGRFPQRHHQRDRLILIVLTVVAFTYFVVFVERGQRRITVNYARRQGGRNAYMNQTSFLPLKLNMAGVIPPIFASSILAFPATLALWSGQSTSTLWLQRVSQALAPGEPLHMIVFAATDHRLRVLLYGAGVQFAGNRGQPEEVRRADSGHPSWQGNGGLRGWRADALDRGRFAVPGGRLPVAGHHASAVGHLVLLRRHLAVDRGRGGDGLHRAGPGAPDVAPVRRPVEESQFERRFARRSVARLSKKGGSSARAWPRWPGSNIEGRPVQRSRAQVRTSQSLRQSSAGRGRSMKAQAGSDRHQAGSGAGAWAHSPRRVPAGFGLQGLPSNPRSC